jgi:mycothiol synthase
VRSIGWRSALSDDEQRKIRGLIAASKQADGVAPVGDQVLRELAHDRTKHLLAVDGDGIVGYLNLVAAGDDSPAMAEAVVIPTPGGGYRLCVDRTGLDEGGDGARIWAHGNLDPAKSMAAALGSTSPVSYCRSPPADRPAAGDPLAGRPAGHILGPRRR